MIDYFSASMIVDDIVLPDGQTKMGMLGGGGPQTAFGMKLWATGGVGLCGGVGTDFPLEAQAWLEAMGIDTEGVRRDPAPTTLRAWQIVEADGRRTQLWRTRGDAIPRHLALRMAQVPAHYRRARGFHFGVHPEQPNLALVAALHAQGIVVSIEPFREANRVLADVELAALLQAADIFSPNLAEAESLVGSGEPGEVVARLVEAGARIVALRMGAEGSLLRHAGARKSWHVPAVPVPVVDPVGAGNAYCGALLVGWVETHDLGQAGLYASVAASFLVEQHGLPAPRLTLRAEAEARLAELEGKVQTMEC